MFKHHPHINRQLGQQFQDMKLNDVLEDLINSTADYVEQRHGITLSLDERQKIARPVYEEFHRVGRTFEHWSKIIEYVRNK